MKTLDGAGGDIDFAVAEGLASVVQRVLQRLGFFRGEWFLDTAQGTPYINEVVGHQVDLALAKQAITSQIRGVPDVTGVSDVEISVDYKARRLSYSATVATIYGDTEIQTAPILYASPPSPQAPPSPVIPDDVLGDYWGVGSVGDYWSVAPAYTSQWTLS